MFCNSLLKRPQWSSVPTTLLTTTKAKWQEKKLDTHDIALPIPDPSQPSRQQFLRLILLSASDLTTNNATTMSRIERLQLQGDDKNIGVIFLLCEKTDGNESMNGSMAFVNLQLNIQNTPLIPLYSLSKLTNTLESLHRSITASLLQRPKPPANPLTTLLPYCSNHPPIPQSSLNVLSDICRDIPALAQMATTEDAKAVLRDMCPAGEEQAMEDVMEFWGIEIIAD